MKNQFSVLSFVCLSLISACDTSTIDKNYNDLGRFSSRVEAENRGMDYLLTSFNSLPDNKDYKLKYSFPDSVNTTAGKLLSIRNHAMWYNKSSQKLGVETDIYSGMACSWAPVDKSLLEKAIAIKLGIVGVDSLSQPAGGKLALCFN